MNTYQINHKLSEKLKTKANEDNIDEWYKEELKLSNQEFIDWLGKK